VVFPGPADRRKVRAGDDGDVGGGSGVSQVNAAAETAGGSGLGGGAGGGLTGGVPVANWPAADSSSGSLRLQETGPVLQESRPGESGAET